ncbi:hypothetical protein LNO23_27235 [Klebsiella pneumoniae subsp. pneumoniae]|nr:hypothetical protein [Klebsiella pneumoniae subsp. pneumoniae]
MLPCRSRENAPAFTPCVGGAAFNTAIDLGRQGMAVALFSGLSDDFMGDMLRHTLERLPAWIIRPQPARRYRPRWPLSGWKADRRAIPFTMRIAPAEC